MDPFNPDESLRGGTEYMAHQLANVRLTVGSQVDVTPDNLYRFALASYNCGFGYVRAALKDLLARQQPLTWENFRASLPQATVRGLKPDHKQALGYAEKILPVV
jgi:membrane-bound lytic murein transglycosylase MltF